MRKVAGILLAAAMVLPVGLIASPAGAAVVNTCKGFSGSATFTPPLPKLGSTTLVKGVLAAKGTITGCSGGGVTGGTFTSKSTPAKTGSNCHTLITYSATAASTSIQQIKWNTGKTSTVTVSLFDIKGKVGTVTVKGTVTAGLFKGLHQSGELTYKEPAGACTKIALASVTFTSVGPSVIK